MKRIILEQQILTAALSWVTLVSDTPQTFQPGQWLLVHCGAPDSVDPWLMQPFWIVRASEQTVTLHVPLIDRGGRWLASQPRGVEVRCSSILGTPFKTRARTVMLLSEGVQQGVGLAIVDQITTAGGSALVLASGPAEQRVPPYSLPPEVEYLANDTDVLSLLDTTTSLDQAVSPLQWADLVLFAGSESTALQLAQRLRRERVRWNREHAWYVPAVPLLCGTGICGSCWVANKQGRTLACQHGLFYDLYDLRASEG